VAFVLGGCNTGSGAGTVPGTKNGIQCNCKPSEVQRSVAGGTERGGCHQKGTKEAYAGY